MSVSGADETVLTCEQAIRLLAAYLDLELDPSSRGDVERHLSICRSCYSRHEFEKRLKAQLAQLDEEQVSPGFQERIHGLVARFSAARTAHDTD